MSQVIVDISGDTSRLQAAYDAAEKSDKSLRDSLASTGKVGQTAAETIEREFNSAGDKSTKAFGSIIRELRKAGPEGRQVAGEIERHLQETGKAGRQSMDSILNRLSDLDPVAAEAANAMRKHIADASEVVEAKLVKLPGPFDKIKKQARSVFGPEGMASLTSYATGLGGITAAIGLAGEAFDQFREKQGTALGSLQEQADPEKRLAQIATSGVDLDAMIGQADEMSLKYGMSREQTRNLMFSARSEGFSEDVGQIARFGRVVDVESQGALAGSLGRLFKGEGLSVEQRLSGVLAAAESSAFDFETVGRSVTKSAAASTNSGSDLAETLAANATLANLIGETAGDRLSTFASKVALNPELKGKGVLAAAESLESAPEDVRRKFLGDSKELNEAYTLLTENAEALREMTKAVRADIQASSSGGGVLRQRTETVEGSSRFQMREMVRRSEIAKEIAEEQRYSKSGAAIAAGENNLSADLSSRGVGEMNQTLVNSPISRIPLVGGVVSSVVGDWSFAEGAMQAGSAVGIDPSITSSALGATAATNDIGATRNGGIARTLIEKADPLGGARAFGSLYDAVSPREEVSDRIAREITSAIREQTELQRQSLAANQQTAANTRPQLPSPQQPPPTNYSSGLESAAASAAMP